MVLETYLKFPKTILITHFSVLSLSFISLSIVGASFETSSFFSSLTDKASSTFLYSSILKFSTMAEFINSPLTFPFTAIL